MELKFGIWQFIEVSYMCWILYKSWKKNGQPVWTKSLTELCETLKEKGHNPMKVIKGFLLTISVISLSWWFFVVYMGGISRLGMLTYVIFAVGYVWWEVTKSEAEIRAMKFNFEKSFNLQMIYQVILFLGGFYTTKAFF